MAEKRMFTKSIVLSDKFLEMPATTRCLYFTLGMLADDDGFIDSPNAIMRQCQASKDDMRLLISKQYLIEFQSGVIVIRHWRMNNYLQNDRHHDTAYQAELNALGTDSKGAYLPLNGVLDTTCIQPVYADKNSIDKVSIEQNSKSGKPPRPTLDEVIAYCADRGNKVDAEHFYNYYSSQGWKKANGRPLIDWKAAVVTWEKKEKDYGHSRDSKAGEKPAKEFDIHYDNE